MARHLPPVTVPRESVEVWPGYTLDWVLDRMRAPTVPLYAPHWLHSRAVAEGIWDPGRWACSGVWDESRHGAFCPDEPRPLTLTAPDPCDFRPVLHL